MLFRIFTFGIGSGASTELVKGLARAGNGTAEFIKEGERMQPKVNGGGVSRSKWHCVVIADEGKDTGC